MLLLLFFSGFITTLIGALPPGAANVAVIQSTSHNNKAFTKKIILGASIGEMLLSCIALQYTMQLASFFAANPWVQIVVFSLFITIGTVLLFPLKRFVTLPKSNLTFYKHSPFIKGFMLAFINPPVLLFWVLAFGIFQYVGFDFSEMSTTLHLIVFFSSVFVSKALVLKTYEVFGQIQHKKTSNTNKLYRGIGIALLLLGVAQALRFVIF